MRVYRRRYFGCGSWFRNDGGTGKRDKDFRCLERGCNSLEFSVGIKSRDGTICLNCIREKRKSSHEYLAFGIPCPVIRQRVAISVVEHPHFLPRARDRLDKREGKARYCHSVSRPGTNTRFEHFPAIRNEIERGENSFLSFARLFFYVYSFSSLSLSIDEAVVKPGARRTTTSSKDPRARAPTTRFQISRQILRARLPRSES